MGAINDDSNNQVTLEKPCMIKDGTSFMNLF